MVGRHGFPIVGLSPGTLPPLRLEFRDLFLEPSMQIIGGRTWLSAVGVLAAVGEAHADSRRLYNAHLAPYLILTDAILSC